MCRFIFHPKRVAFTIISLYKLERCSKKNNVDRVRLKGYISIYNKIKYILNLVYIKLLSLYIYL